MRAARLWIRRAAMAIAHLGLDGGDVVGLAAFLMIFLGVRGLAGSDWALLALGVPFAALYLRRELREPKAQRRYE